MPLVDEFSSLSLGSPRYEASALQALQTIVQAIVQARTHAPQKLSFEESEKLGAWQHMLTASQASPDLEEITAVNRNLHFWLKALSSESRLTIDVAIVGRSTTKCVLVERWVISYTGDSDKNQEELPPSPDLASSWGSSIVTTSSCIHSLYKSATLLPIYRWMQGALVAGDYSFVSQYGPMPDNNPVEFSSPFTVETLSLPTITSMFGHFKLSVLHTREIDSNLLKTGAYTIMIAPSHTSSKPTNDPPLNSSLTTSSKGIPIHSGGSGSLVTSVSPLRSSAPPSAFSNPSSPIHTRSQAIRIPGSASRSMYRSGSADEIGSTLHAVMSPPSGGSFRGGFLSPPHTPNSPIFAASDRLPCISPSELIGPFVGSFQESILSGHMSNTSCTSFNGFVADLGVSGKDFIPPHYRVPFTAMYYHIDHDTPYAGTVDLEEEGYRVASKGLIQLTVFNPFKTPIKTFLVKYDLTGMTPETKTFLRQKIVTSNGILRVPDDAEKLKVIYETPTDPKFFPVYDGSIP